MNMQELGDILRQEREKQGLSLDEVHEWTKISKSALRSLESGTAEDLPHPVYTKGFIKNYAELLGLDGDELAAEFSRNLSREGQYEEMEEAHEAVMAAESQPKRGLGVTLSIAATVILLGVLGWLVYDLFLKPPAEVGSSAPKQTEAAANATSNASVPGSGSGDEPNPETGTSPAEPEEAATEEAASEEAAREAQPKEAPAAAAPQAAKKARPDEAPKRRSGSVIRAQSPQEEAAGAQEPKRMQNATPAPAGTRVDNATQALKPEKIRYAPENGSQSNAEAQPSEAASANAKEHVLRIEATEECWFEAQVDGASRDVYLRPGESVRLRFQNDLLVKLGNAGGVMLQYDGEPYSLEAESGEVKTLTFP